MPNDPLKIDKYLSNKWIADRRREGKERSIRKLAESEQNVCKMQKP